MYKSPYSSVWSCIRTVYAAEGIRAFYRSYVTQLTMNIPFQSIHFMVYESMQGVTNPERSYNPKAHMLSGAMAGAIAAAITTPLDVCKTLLNTQEATTLTTLGQPRIVGLSHAFRTVYRLGGVRGYFQVRNKLSTNHQKPFAFERTGLVILFLFDSFKPGCLGPRTVSDSINRNLLVSL